MPGRFRSTITQSLFFCLAGTGTARMTWRSNTKSQAVYGIQIKPARFTMPRLKVRIPRPRPRLSFGSRPTPFHAQGVIAHPYMVSATHTTHMAPRTLSSATGRHGPTLSAQFPFGDFTPRQSYSLRKPNIGGREKGEHGGWAELGGGGHDRLFAWIPGASRGLALGAR